VSERYEVKDALRARAHINSMEEYERLYRLSLDNPEWFWAEQAKRLSWFHPWTMVFDADYEEVDFSWFSGGRLNACYNCVDRHVPERGEQTAIIWASDEPGIYKHISYRELKHQVARMANVLLKFGVRKGDRVCIYMPMIPEAAYAMLACARIGAVHSVVFGGFSAEALRDRIVDAGAKVVITHHRRRGTARRPQDPAQGHHRPRGRGDGPRGDRAGRAPHRHRSPDETGAGLGPGRGMPPPALDLHRRVDGG
jgi:acetyl-CoA synthetase